ncbi:hypothetical protein C8034_v012053 [Colletotrichum sidae]|uniref:Uncharacterized protein n=1 Tax=Colletotrichum sidae TaxID=1347389 RepID=A0A4R8THJ6_9PEZI|nr:hypothetical protein C8034_v012053 [Colletotrichum sidae]
MFLHPKHKQLSRSHQEQASSTITKIQINQPHTLSPNNSTQAKMPESTTMCGKCSGAHETSTCNKCSKCGKVHTGSCPSDTTSPSKTKAWWSKDGSK